MRAAAQDSADVLDAFADRALFTSMTRMTADEQRNLVTSDPARAVRCIKAAAACGLVQAQLSLGRMLLEGTDVSVDHAAALQWFRRAAESGEPEAENMVGRCHENAWGVVSDPEAAVLWYRKAADKGYAWAQYNLGHMYLDGVGVARDRDVAFSLYRQAAEQGHERAMNLVGRCYEEGWGIGAPDIAAAYAWYRRSAEQGYFRGQYNYATCLLNDGCIEDASIWLRRAVVAAPKVTRQNICMALAKSAHRQIQAIAAEMWPDECATPLPDDGSAQSSMGAHT